MQQPRYACHLALLTKCKLAAPTYMEHVPYLLLLQAADNALWLLCPPTLHPPRMMQHGLLCSS
jgi:hypothetical protein